MSFLKKPKKTPLQIRSVNCGGKYTFFPHIYSRLLKRLKTLKSLSSRFGSLTVDLTGQFGSSFGDFFFSAALCSNFMPDFGHLWLFCTFVILSRISVVILYLALIVWGHLSKFVVISSVFLVISCVSVQVLWVLFLTFVLTLPITDCFTSQFGCFTHYFDYFWTLYAPDCGHFVVTIFSLFLKVFLWSSFTLWSFYKYLWLLWTSIQFFCFYFGYFEVTMHQILLIMVIMLFCPTLRQLGASFCGCSLHFNFFARGSHYMSLWSFDILLWGFFEFMRVFCDHIMVLCANFMLYLWIICVPLWSFYVFVV